ncbi:MAG: MFS transporter [Simkaniaceae bacterium]|nr:MFS transporter [Simkaniaceae bacterium]
MGLFKKKNEKKGFFQTIEKMLHRFGVLKRESFYERHAIHFLNTAQFLGVVNDNFFKYLIVFLFIDLKGIEASPIILTWVGIIYVLPFLLFSSVAGAFADKFSKQRIIILLKFTEVIIMALGIVAFLCKSDWASYTLLFLLSMQSAIFGPPKYSIIPELVKEEDIPKANGLIASFTYFGIIFGTFLASFLTQITNKNFPLTAGIGTLLAVLGFIASVLIPKTASKQTTKRINPFFLYEIYKNLVYASKIPYLLAAIFGSASFLFIGAYFQLNVIPYAVQSMGCSEVAGGYLFLLTAVGIAIGALLAGRLCKAHPETGLACLAGMIASIIFFLLGIFYHFFLFIFISVFALGLFGGLYIVPFDAFIQRFTPHQRRGQVVAAANFLSFCGVLMAPILLFFFSEVITLSAAQGFMMTGGMIFVLVLVIASRLSGFFFHYLARTFVKPLYKVEVKNFPLEKERPFVLILREKITGVHIALLAAFNPKLHFYIPRTKKRYMDFFLHFFSSIDFLYVRDLDEEALKNFLHKTKKRKEQTPCLLFPYPKFLEEESLHRWVRELKESKDFDLVFVRINKVARKDQSDWRHFNRSKVSLIFSKEM